jgi:hypothetical protein
MRIITLAAAVAAVASLGLLAARMSGSEASQRCANLGAGFTVAVPSELEPDSRCELFDTRLAELRRNTDAVSADVFAIAIEEPIERVLAAFRQDSGERVITAAPVRFGPNTAWRVEAELVERQLRPAGARSYRYFVPVAPARTVVFSTVEDHQNDYDENRELLDRLVARVEPILPSTLVTSSPAGGSSDPSTLGATGETQ